MNVLIYLAYGSNMNPERMRIRGVKFRYRKRGILRGWSLVFNKIASDNAGAGYANIIRDDTGVVEGILYEIPEDDLTELDRYEGYPQHYKRIMLLVQTDEGIVEAAVYVANQDKIKEGRRPKKEYLRHLIKGSDILSEDYRRKLASIETLD